MIGISFRAFGLAVTAAVILLSAPAAADKQVVFQRLTEGPAFEKARKFLGDYLEPEDYLDRAKRDRIAGDRNPDPAEALAHYIRTFILFGAGDVDDDGIDEWFYIMDEPIVWCGTAGCKMTIWKKHNEGWDLIGDVTGVARSVRITDWISEGSDYREVDSVFRIYWQGNRYHPDIPEIREGYGFPPPPARLWKPMR